MDNTLNSNKLHLKFKFSSRAHSASINLILACCFAFLWTSCSRPTAKFIYQGKTIAPSKVAFVNQSEKGDKYLWDFGDGNTSEKKEPEHRYLMSGNYIVKLKVTNEKNKSRVAEQNIKIGPPDQCLVQMETEYGNILIILYDDTPLHQENFTKLADEGFYDDLLFHRVIKGFMIQGGDPDSKGAKPKQRLGMGGPGYQVPAEFADSLIHVKGALAAARNNNPEKKSSGSQFYLVHGSELTDAQLDQIEARRGVRYTNEQREKYLSEGGTPFLDGEYTVFGQVIEGLDVIDKIAAVKTDGSDRPTEDVKMKIKVIK